MVKKTATGGGFRSLPGLTERSLPQASSIHQFPKVQLSARRLVMECVEDVLLLKYVSDFLPFRDEVIQPVA